MDPYYAQTTEDVLEHLHSRKEGLNSKEVQHRLSEFGRNELEKAKKDSLLKLFLSQFNNFLIYILIGAVIIAGLAGEYIDAIVITIILILNAILGFVQEYKAEKAIAALQKLASLQATVLRDGKKVVIDAGELVPGDIICLESGSKVPADARLIEEIEISALEAALTGESVPVSKSVKALSRELSVGDRKNMVFSGTSITNGRGVAVVTATGMHTQLGNIAGLIQEIKREPTPLQRKLEKFGKRLGVVVIMICAVTFATGVARGIDWIEMLIASVALAVAAVPEGLPAVVTITLALGVQEMVKRNVLVRKLPSVETLGSCTVICSDKTGTLTHNQMTVERIYVDGKVLKVSGEGYNKDGKISEKTKDIELLLRVGALCNSAEIDKSKTRWRIIGDPTEGALLVSAEKLGLEQGALHKKYPKTKEIPFSSEKMMMTTVHGQFVCSKGAPDVIIEKCTHVLHNGHKKKLSKSEKGRILLQNEVFAKDALRVLGFAYKETASRPEQGLVFLGLQAMIDPPRQDAIDAIKKCEAAGIKVIMITGDHKATAQAIAKAMGIPGNAIDGLQLSKMGLLSKHVEDIGVYARVEPSQKVKIVEALKSKAHIVAMTGDGVNDAPALKKADIGVAMGITGTDVAKEASDMIVLDDNFASIVAAVEKGRNIFDNIQKFVEYLLSCNLGEVSVIFIGLLLGLPLPLIAIQILWMNLVTDGLPALSLGLDPVEPGVMEATPKKKTKILEIDGRMRVGFVALVMLVGTLGVFWFSNPGANIIYARTMAFTTLVCMQLFQAINCRSLHKSLLRVGVFRNMWLWGAIACSLGLQLMVLYSPLNVVFEVVPLVMYDWMIVGAVSASVFVLVELGKVAKFFMARA